MTLDSWLTFVAIWTLAGLPLGPNAVHTISVAVRHGFPRCLYAPVGMAIACIVHATVASLGVGALLLLYPNVFFALKLFGAAYLAWLGVKLWLKPAGSIELSNPGAETAFQMAKRACIVSLVNPKAILSYVAIFSPFVSANDALFPQLLILIPTATIIVFFNYVGYSLLAWPIRNWLNSGSKQKLFNRLSGTMFIGFAMLLAMSTKQASE